MPAGQAVVEDAIPQHWSPDFLMQTPGGSSDGSGAVMAQMTKFLPTTKRLGLNSKLPISPRGYCKHFRVCPRVWHSNQHPKDKNRKIKY